MSLRILNLYSNALGCGYTTYLIPTADKQQVTVMLVGTFHQHGFPQNGSAFSAHGAPPREKQARLPASLEAACPRLPGGTCPAQSVSLRISMAGPGGES